tara:strand:- start:274 stop:537 length:264 start_codon:yes stop_codon:yes gene_type:complete
MKRLVTKSFTIYENPKLLMTTNFSRNSTTRFGNFELFTTKPNTDFLLFGIKPTKPKLLPYQLTELKRKQQDTKKRTLKKRADNEKIF